ncbi:hypothetical protein JW960_28480 [candidate division KSB1 bacterium]|nr:hypothetical protein [candidate division KSB1 bacterium]
MKFCQEQNISRLLVDLRDLNTKNIATSGCYSFGASLALTCPLLRIAHILPKDRKSNDDVRFTSTVETNRGIMTGEFSTVEEARDWLLQ